MSVIDRLYKLQPYGRENEFHYVVLLPEPLPFEVVIAAWAYAVCYTVHPSCFTEIKRKNFWKRLFSA